MTVTSEPPLGKLQNAKRKVGAIAVALLAPLVGLAFLLGMQHVLAGREDGVQSTLCVAPGGAGGCNPSIAAALAAASPGDTIRVAAGTYVENVVIVKTVVLEGGWNADFTLRDPGVFSATIRPADNTQSVVSVLVLSATVDGFVVTGGRAELGGNHGGGLRLIDSQATVRNNTIISNSAFLLGGGVWVQRGAPTLENNRIEDNTSLGQGQDAYGGGVQLENSRATLVGNRVISNTVRGTLAYGGGIDIVGVEPALLRDNAVISNTADAPGASGAFGGGVSVRGSSVAVLESGLYAGNRADDGGGLFADGATVMAVFSSTIRDNVIGSGDGGGIHNLGRLTISNTTVSGNRALLAGGNGGGLLNDGAVEVVNSTFSGNAAPGAGGGIRNTGQISLAHVTVYNNTAPFGAGVQNMATTLVQSTVIAGNLPGNCSDPLFSLGHNLEDTDTCSLVPGQNDLIGVSPALEPLADNGGPAMTHALAEGSPAIDAADNATCPPTDQRGVPRPLDGDQDGIALCDIGALEYQPPTHLYLPLVTKMSPDPSSLSGSP